MPSGRPPRLLFAASCGLFAVFAPPRARAQAPEAAPEAAAAETGELEIKAPVDGAVLWIDNVEVGTLPVKKDVSAGKHTIRVAARGYDPFVRSVTVRAGTRSALTATLTRGGGTVEFGANAPGAKVLIDGQAESPVPVRLGELPTGEHSYKITAPGHEPVEGAFQYDELDNVFVYAQMVSSRGLFVVETDPPGARVVIDGEDKGVSPLTLQGLAAAPHVVDIQLDGYARELLTVDTSDGSKGEVRSELSKRGATALVKTGSDDAEVVIGGVVVGTGKKVVVPKLARGRYDIEVRKPGVDPATGRVKVPEGGRAAYKAEFVKEGQRGRSKVIELPPFYENWVFWTAVGVGSTSAVTGGVVVYQATRPIPIPDGDVTVTLP